MNRSVFALGPALLVSIALSAVASPPPDVVEFAGSQTVVMKNGRVIQGRVVRRDDRLEVSRMGESMIRIPVKLVDFVAPDLRTAYRHQSDRIKDSDIDSRVRLVEWCLHNDLVGEAAEQYAVVKYLAPKHPKFAYLTKRLELTRRKKPVLPASVASRPKSASVTPAELTRFTRQMPAGTVEQFTHVIQPMLVNRCGAAACHGVRSESEYRLIQPSMAGAFSHRYTQRNLYATTQQIRKGSLPDSKWLAAATRPHGGLTKPLFGEKEIDNLQRLIAWARSIGPAPRKLSAAAIAAAQLAKPRDKPRYDANVRQAAFTQPSGRKSPPPRKPVGPPASKKPYVDPFDPSGFNEAKQPPAKQNPK